MIESIQHRVQYYLNENYTHTQKDIRVIDSGCRSGLNEEGVLWNMMLQIHFLDAFMLDKQTLYLKGGGGGQSVQHRSLLTFDSSGFFFYHGRRLKRAVRHFSFVLIDIVNILHLHFLLKNYYTSRFTSTKVGTKLKHPWVVREIQVKGHELLRGEIIATL